MKGNILILEEDISLKCGVKILCSGILAGMLTCSAAFAQAEPLKGPVNPAFEEYIQDLQKAKPQGFSEKENYGYIPSPVMIAPRQGKLVKAETLPEKFDLREQDGVTSVKNQGRRGS